MTSLDVQLFGGPLKEILRKVSRTFYFSLKILPQKLRAPLALTYLLARSADTITDTDLLSAERRLYWLGRLKEGLIESPREPMNPSLSQELEDSHNIPEERQLLERIDLLIRLYWEEAEEDRGDIREVLTSLMYGMERELHHFQIRTMKDLDEYCFYAAGVVGPFWTRLTRRHDPRLRLLDHERMEALGVQFGKGLQLINVVKDVARDDQEGRCHWPQEELSHLGVETRSLNQPHIYNQLQPLTDRLLQQSLHYLSSGQQYLLCLPRRCYTSRLAVLWPLWIGLATLDFLASDTRLFDPHRPHKISKRTLIRWMLLSTVVVLSQGGIRYVFRSFEKSLLRRLQRQVLTTPI